MDNSAALAAFLELLIKALADGTFLPIGAGLVVALTAIFKRFLPENIGSGVLAIAFQVVVWIAWVIVQHLGFGDQFGTWINSITTIITAVGGLVGSSFLATKAYNYAVAQNVPLFGTQRASSASASALARVPDDVLDQRIRIIVADEMNKVVAGASKRVA